MSWVYEFISNSIKKIPFDVSLEIFITSLFSAWILVLTALPFLIPILSQQPRMQVAFTAQTDYRPETTMYELFVFFTLLLFFVLTLVFSKAKVLTRFPLVLQRSIAISCLLFCMCNCMSLAHDRE